MSEPHLTLTPLVSQIRVYSQPNGYENRVPYECVVTVTHMTDKIAYLSAAFGKMDRKTHEGISALLKEQGVEQVLFERHGKIITVNP